MERAFFQYQDSSNETQTGINNFFFLYKNNKTDSEFVV